MFRLWSQSNSPNVPESPTPIKAAQKWFLVPSPMTSFLVRIPATSWLLLTTGRCLIPKFRKSAWQRGSGASPESELQWEGLGVNCNEKAKFWAELLSWNFIGSIARGLLPVTKSAPGFKYGLKSSHRRPSWPWSNSDSEEIVGLSDSRSCSRRAVPVGCQPRTSSKENYQPFAQKETRVRCPES